jgi:hypothetical protein
MTGTRLFCKVSNTRRLHRQSFKGSHKKIILTLVIPGLSLRQIVNWDFTTKAQKRRDIAIPPCRITIIN